jgi:hypothetical protein
VPRRDFDENLLMNDYSLLDEAGRVAPAAARATIDTAPTAPSASAHSKRAILAREAAARDVRLHLLPRGFARARRNSSHARGRKGSRQLYWHLDVVFVQPGKERRVNVDSCSEGATVAEIVAGAMDAMRRRNRSRDVGSFAGAVEEHVDVYILNEHVVGPASSEAENLSVAGKAVGEDDLHRYLPLTKKQALSEVLCKRIIIEFPIFYCVLKGSQEAQRLSSAMVGVFEKPEPESESESESDDSDEESQTASVSDGGIVTLDDGVVDIGDERGDAVAVEEDAASRPAKRSRLSTTPSRLVADVEAAVNVQS